MSVKDMLLLQKSKDMVDSTDENAYWPNWVQALSRHSRSSITDIAVSCITSSCVFRGQPVYG